MTAFEAEVFPPHTPGRKCFRLQIVGIVGKRVTHQSAITHFTALKPKLTVFQGAFRKEVAANQL